MKINLMKLFVSSILWTTFFSTAPALAVGGDKGNGGDEIGLEFTQSFLTAVEFLQKNRALLPLEAGGFKQFIESVNVLTVDHELEVELGGIVQKAVAVNFAFTMTVQVNRDRWKQIENPYIKEAIALHEILSLKGFERTGQYSYSAQYLAARKLDSAVLIGGGSTLRNDYMYEFLKNSPDYLKSLMVLTSPAPYLDAYQTLPLFATTLISIRTQCSKMADGLCETGVTFYETQVTGHVRQNGRELHIPSGVIYGTVRFSSRSETTANVLPIQVTFIPRFPFSFP